MKNFLIITSTIFFIGCNAFAASFDCRKANSPIEKTICNNKILSELDSQLGHTYKKVLENKNEVLTKQIRTKQKKWLKSRNNECKNSSIPCLKTTYEKQIEWLENIPALYYACEKISHSLKQGSFTELQYPNYNVGKIQIKKKFKLEDFFKSKLYSSIRGPDKEYLNKHISKGYYIFSISEDINEDSLVDNIIYQTLGTMKCCEPYILIRQKDLSLKLAETPSYWDSDCFFIGVHSIFGIGDERWFGNTSGLHRRGARITLYGDKADRINGRCSILFGVNLSFKITMALSYHHEFVWVKDHLSDLSKAINTESQTNYTIKQLETFATRSSQGKWIIEFGNKNITLKFNNQHLEIKNKTGKFIPLNEHWKLKKYADKYRNKANTSYLTINKFDAQYLFFIGSDEKLYFIYWGNGEMGWRQSEYQIMFLYKLMDSEPEYIDTLLLKPTYKYYKKSINCY